MKAQLGAVEHGQALAGIEHEGDAGGMELRGVLQHGVAPVRGDDAQADVRPRRDAVDVRLHHGAGVEGGDLVVVPVGHDHGLRGVGAGHLAHELGADAQVVQALQVAGAVVPTVAMGSGVPPSWRRRRRCCRRSRRSRGAAGHQERDVQDVQLVGQDLVAKRPSKLMMVSKPGSRRSSGHGVGRRCDEGQG
jgi:hypothetical protein